MIIKLKTQFRTLLAAGILLALGPVWGLLGTAAAMMKAFSRMGQSGMDQPELLAGDIGISLFTTAIGLVTCPIGIAAIIISCIFLSRLKKEERNSRGTYSVPAP